MLNRHFAGTRTVVVTEGSSEIGEACALLLDTLSFQVFVGRSSTALQCRASNKLTPITLDVSDTPSISLAAETVANIVGEEGLFGLVNNPEITITAQLEFLPLAELRTHLEGSLLRQLVITQAFLRLLRLGRGRIVNVGSIMNSHSSRLSKQSFTSNFVIETLTDILCLELRPQNIRVSLVQFDDSELSFKETPGVAAEGTDAMHEPVADADKIETYTNTVAKTIIHALTTAKLKARYTVLSKQ
jgi:NAD(P)-dependent dehydrogenase (short-subunit alcohol dehydrogenase family)